MGLYPNDSSCLRLLEVRQGELRSQEERPEVDTHDPVPGVHLELLAVAGDECARVVHEDVYAAKPLDSMLDEVLYRSFLGHLLLHILIRESQADASRVNIPVTKLLLEGIKATCNCPSCLPRIFRHLRLNCKGKANQLGAFSIFMRS